MASQRVFPRLMHSTARQSLFRQPVRPQQFFQRRVQSTAAPNAEQSGLSKFWNSAVGPKTVHFWAPIMKWGVVLAGVADFFRPASALSLQQNLALTATGAIWTRWCFVIKPRNLFLAAVNFFLFAVGVTQSARVLVYRSSLKDEVEDMEETAESIVKDPKGAAERATKV